MNIDFSQKLRDLNGKPLKWDESNAEPRAIRLRDADGNIVNTILQVGELKIIHPDLGHVAVLGLQYVKRGEEISPEEGLKRWELARMCNKKEVVDITHDQGDLIQKQIARIYGPLIIGQTYEMLEGNNPWEDMEIKDPKRDGSILSNKSLAKSGKRR